SRLQALLTEGAITRDGAKISDGNTRVKPGEIYAVQVPKAAPALPQAQDIPLTVVYEDQDLIVIDKPAGLVVHPAAGNPDGTLVNALLAHCGDSLAGIGGTSPPGIVHRLGKDTHGILVAAENDAPDEKSRQAIRRACGGTRLQRRGVGRPAAGRRQGGR